jgi:hypothetical protein
MLAVQVRMRTLIFCEEQPEILPALQIAPNRALPMRRLSLPGREGGIEISSADKSLSRWKKASPVPKVHEHSTNPPLRSMHCDLSIVHCVCPISLPHRSDTVKAVARYAKYLKKYVKSVLQNASKCKKIITPK